MKRALLGLVQWQVVNLPGEPGPNSQTSQDMSNSVNVQSESRHSDGDWNIWPTVKSSEIIRVNIGHTWMVWGSILTVFWRVFEGDAIPFRFLNPVVYHTRCRTASGPTGNAPDLHLRT